MPHVGSCTGYFCAIFTFWSCYSCLFKIFASLLLCGKKDGYAKWAVDWPVYKWWSCGNCLSVCSDPTTVICYKSLLSRASRPVRFRFSIHQSAWTPWVCALDSTWMWLNHKTPPCTVPVLIALLNLQRQTILSGGFRKKLYYLSYSGRQ